MQDCDEGENGEPCDRCNQMLQKERESELAVAELKKQYEADFGEVYGSWWYKDEEEQRYYTFWEFAMSHRQLWEDPSDPEKEHDNARKLWAEEWRTGKKMYKHLKVDKVSFEEFWSCWEWKRNRDRYAKQYTKEAELRHNSAFWDDIVKRINDDDAEAAAAAEKEQMDLEEEGCCCCKEAEVEQVRERMDALEAVDDEDSLK